MATARNALRVFRGTAHAPYLYRVITDDFKRPGCYIVHFRYEFNTDSVHCQVLRGVEGNTIIGRHETKFDTGRKANEFTDDDALDFVSGYIAAAEANS